MTAQFDGYPWHAEVVARLAQLERDGELPNAIALTSSAGWGNDALLNAACNLLLQQPADTDASQLAHPDLRWIVPDGAVIKVEQVRRINEFAVQTPQIAPRKVAAISAAHLLNESAANALLKTLEEPPRDTHLLLATTRWGRLLPTIRSRCQRFQHAQSSESAQRWLEEQGVELRMRDFAELGYAPLALPDGDTPDFDAWLARTDKADLQAIVKEVQETDLVAWLGRWYRRIALTLVQAPRGAAARNLLEFSDELIDVRRQIETSNSANWRLLLERLVVLWRKLS